VNLVDELLTDAGVSMDGLMADALAEKRTTSSGSIA
jgi:hypothetical protein